MKNDIQPKLPPMLRQKSANGQYYYVYTGEAVWNPQKKRSEIKNKTSIGRLSGDRVIFSSRYLEKHPELVGVDVRHMGKGYHIVSVPRAEGEVIDLQKVCAKNYGASYAFTQIAKSIGLIEDLQAAFPERANEILACAYLILLYPDLNACNFDIEQGHTDLPTELPLTSQFLSNFFDELSRDRQAIMEFFKLRSNFVFEQNKGQATYLAFDSTSVSTASKENDLAAYGKNKDGDVLPQVNIALLSDQASGMPIYYRLLNGSVVDVVTLTNLFRDASQLDLEDFHIVLDRGYYSEANIDMMLGIGVNFVIGVQTRLNFVKSAMLNAAQKMWRIDRKSMIENGDEEYLYTYTQELTWGFKGVNGSKGDAPVYVHLYANNERAAELQTIFSHKLNMIEQKQLAYEAANQGLKDGQEDVRFKLSKDEWNFLNEYFTRNEKTGTWEDNYLAQSRNSDTFGVFCLVSNDIKNAKEALEIYHDRDMVERDFKDLKQRLNAKRPHVQSSEAMMGKTFVQFIALTIRMVMHHRVALKNRKKTLKYNSITRLINSLNALNLVSYANQYRCVQEVTKTQRTYYELIDVAPPTNG